MGQGTMTQSRALTLGPSPGAADLTLVPGAHYWPLGSLSFGKLLNSEVLTAKASKPCPYFMHDGSVITIPNSKRLRAEHEALTFGRGGGGVSVLHLRRAI